MKKGLIYLGFVVSEEELKMDLDKVQAILSWPIPRRALEVRSFHGLASFYRKFIKNFSQICAPIIDTFKGSRKPFKWTEAADRNFKLLKKKINEKPILALPSFDKVFQAYTNASGTTIGVVLSQEHRLVAYFNEKLNEAKQKYSSYDKELYVVVHTLKKQRHYLMPKEYVLYYDNCALQFINSQPKLNQKHAKCVEF